MATGKDAADVVVAGKKDNAQGSPRAVGKSPNFPMTDDADPSTKAADNAANATDGANDDLSLDDVGVDGLTSQERAERKSNAYKYGADLSATEGKDVDEESDDYLLAQTLVGEDLAYITTVQKGGEVKKQVFATDDGYTKLRAAEDAKK